MERWSQFLRERAAVLEDAGIVVLLPAWWAAPARLGLRARARSSSKSGGSVVPGRFGLEALVDFKYEAALGGRRLNKAELASLARAAAAKQYVGAGTRRLGGGPGRPDRSPLGPGGWTAVDAPRPI